MKSFFRKVNNFRLIVRRLSPDPLNKDGNFSTAIILSFLCLFIIAIFYDAEHFIDLANVAALPVLCFSIVDAIVNIYADVRERCRKAADEGKERLPNLEFIFEQMKYNSELVPDSDDEEVRKRTNEFKLTAEKTREKIDLQNKVIDVLRKIDEQISSMRWLRRTHIFFATLLLLCVPLTPLISHWFCWVAAPAIPMFTLFLTLTFAFKGTYASRIVFEVLREKVKKDNANTME